MNETFPTVRRLILASASPRRHEILLTAGIPHEIRAAHADETLPPDAPPAQAVEMLSARKAAAALAEASEGEIVLAADTVVSLSGKILGKPADREQARLIRRLQPELLINDRLDLPPGNADIDTSVEQFLPENPVVDDSGRLLAWEACHTFSGSWGYHREERTWKSVKMCIDLLVQHVAYGGNMILNVGPTSRGKLDRRTKERLSGMGQWMELNSRAIYGCTRAPKKFVPPADCRYTYNPETRRLYLCLLNWPYLYIHLPELGGGKVKYTQLLADGSEIKRRESAEEQNGSTPPGALTLDLPTLLPEEGCEVPVIEIIFEDSFLSTFEDE